VADWAEKGGLETRNYVDPSRGGGESRVGCEEAECWPGRGEITENCRGRKEGGGTDKSISRLYSKAKGSASLGAKQKFPGEKKHYRRDSTGNRGTKKW